MKLKGRAAIITGGGRGIGRAIALAFAREGADVAINYRRDKDAAQATAAEIAAMGRKALAVQCDVTDYDGAVKMAAQAAEAFGKLDILINNAGIVSRGNTLADTPVEEMRQVVDTHLFGGFYFSKACIPYIRKNPRGDIHFLSSASPHMAPPKHGPYAAAKIAMEKMAEVMAKEEREHNIRVSSIACGVVATEMGKRLVRHTLGGDLSALGSKFPFGRVCQPEDVANLCLFLCSEQGSYISGHTIFLDGSDTIGVAKEE